MKNHYDNYFIQNTYGTPSFSFLFEDCIDKIISDLLPIQYEYQLEHHKLPINNSSLKQYPFLSYIILPKISNTIKDHKAFLEIESLHYKAKLESNYNQSSLEGPIYNNNGVILLNEKAFEAIRQKILFIFFIDTIDECSKSLQEDKSLIDLSSFISYYIDNGNYFFNINLSFDNFIFLLSKDNKKDQLEFWFCFYIPMLNIVIDTIEYDYYFCEMSQFNSDDMKWQLINIYYEYIAFVQKYITEIKSKSIIVTMTNNIFWIEEISGRLNNESLIAYIKSLQLNIYTKLSLMSKMNQSISFDHLILNFYGKYSTMKWKEYISLCLMVNNIKMLIINLFEFNHFEYLKLVKLQKEEMASIEHTSIQLLSLLTSMIKELNKKSIEVIAVQVKKFTSYKSYLKSIITEFNSMIKALIESGIKFIVYFSNILENISNYDLITHKQTIRSSHLNSTNNLTFSNPSLFLDSYRCITKLQKSAKSFSQMFHLSLFEKNIKILTNKTIDFYYFRTYRYNMISNLTLGYFASINELITFLSKISLNSITHLVKAKFYLKTNKGFVYNNLSTLFGLNWPRQSLQSIKFIYEASSAFHNFDVFTLYEELILKKYFVQELPIQKAQSEMNQLPCINDTSFISQYIIQANHSMLMDMTQIMPSSQSIKHSFLFPLQFIGFMKIETYLLHKLNTKTINHIALNISNNQVFNRSLEKKKLKDKFLSSVVVSEYVDVKANCSLLYSITKYDQKKNTSIAKQLMTKIITNHFPSDTMIIQYICRFLKGRRSIFNDFKNSDKVFNKYAHIVGRGYE